MPVKIVCPDCDARYSAPDHLAGKRIRCKKCGGSVSVPTPEDVWERNPVSAPLPAARPARAVQQRRRRTLPTGLILAVGGGAAALIALIAVVSLVDWDRALGLVGMSRAERGMRRSAEIMEEVGSILAAVKDDGSAGAATPRLKALGEELAALIRADASRAEERKAEFEKLKEEIKSLPPQEQAVKLEQHLEEITRLRKKYDPRMAAARDRVKAELGRIREIEGTRDVVRTAMAEFQGTVRDAAFDALNAQFDAMEEGMKNREPFVPPSAPSPAQMAEEARRRHEEAAARARQQITSAGAANTVTFIVTGVPSDPSIRLSKRIRELTGAANVNGNATNGVWRFVAAPVSADVSAIARNIDFGEVTDSDPASRVITVRWTAPPVAPGAPPVEETPSPPPSNTGGFDV